ncbi:hypothetical protein ACN20G_28205 (plasmid) [Streptomyces sp. BI20]|uniref:hypothetical protein n=1 Tax=Streptomyces sp. BI20 TaxID=3403460 RepID=UPI003C7440CB
MTDDHTPDGGHDGPPFGPPIDVDVPRPEVDDFLIPISGVDFYTLVAGDALRLTGVPADKLLLIVEALPGPLVELVVDAGDNPPANLAGYGPLHIPVPPGQHLTGPFKGGRHMKRDGSLHVKMSGPGGATLNVRPFQLPDVISTGLLPGRVPLIGVRVKGLPLADGFTIEWTAPDGITVVVTASDGSVSHTGTVSGNKAMFSGLKQATSYAVTVTATKAGLRPSLPVKLTVKTAGPPPKKQPATPGKPALKPGSKPTPTGVIVGWAHDGKDTTHYLLRRREDPGAQWSIVKRDINAASREATDVGPLVAGKSYVYDVTAYNGPNVFSAASPPSDPIAIPAPPAKPKKPDPPLIAKVATPTSVQIRWDKYPDQASITGLRWECDDQTGGWPTKVAAAKDATTATHTPTKAYGPGPVEFRMIALNGPTESDPSTKLTVTFPAMPSKPAIGANPKPTDVQVTWTSTEADTTNYVVLRREEAQTWDKARTMAQVNVGTKTYQDTTAAAGTTYRYRVHAANGANIQIIGPESDKVTTLSSYGDGEYGEGPYGGDGP